MHALLGPHRGPLPSWLKQKTRHAPSLHQNLKRAPFFFEKRVGRF
jgi:hypothetical protein